MTTPQNVTLKPFKSGDSLAQWVVIFLWLNVAISLIAILSDYAEIRLLSRVIEGQFVTVEEADTNDSRQLIVGLAQMIIFIATAILFSMWLYRVSYNLSPLGIRSRKHTPGWTVAYFYIPIINLYRPYQAIKEIWQASNPETDLTNSNWQQTSTSYILGLWWTLWAAGLLFTRIANRTQRAESLSSMVSSDWMSIISGILITLAAVLALLVVRRINMMQNKKYRHLTMPWA